MNNLSITQKINNNRIERQKFQQSPIGSDAKTMLRRDAVSFGQFFGGMGINAFKNLKPMSEEFIAKLEFGSAASVMDFMSGLNSKSPRLQKAFVLFQDEKGNSHFAKLVKHYPELAGKYLDFVTGIDDKVQKEFALMRNDDGHTHFDIALQNNRSDVAMDFLNFVSGLKMPIQRKFALSRTTYGFENQYNVALGLGHFDAAQGFLDFVKRIGNVTPSKFFLLQDIQGKLPFEAVKRTDDSRVLKSFAKFTSEAVSREYLLKKLLEEVAIENPFSDDVMEKVAVKRLIEERLMPSGFWEMPKSPVAQAQA